MRKAPMQQDHHQQISNGTRNVGCLYTCPATLGKANPHSFAPSAQTARGDATNSRSFLGRLNLCLQANVYRMKIIQVGANACMRSSTDSRSPVGWPHGMTSDALKSRHPTPETPYSSDILQMYLKAIVRDTQPPWKIMIPQRLPRPYLGSPTIFLRHLAVLASFCEAMRMGSCTPSSRGLSRVASFVPRGYCTGVVALSRTSLPCPAPTTHSGDAASRRYFCSARSRGGESPPRLERSRNATNGFLENAPSKGFGLLHRPRSRSEKSQHKALRSLVPLDLMAASSAAAPCVLTVLEAEGIHTYAEVGEALVSRVAFARGEAFGKYAHLAALKELQVRGELWQLLEDHAGCSDTLAGKKSHAPGSGGVENAAIAAIAAAIAAVDALRKVNTLLFPKLLQQLQQHMPCCGIALLSRCAAAATHPAVRRLLVAAAIPSSAGVHSTRRLAEAPKAAARRADAAVHAFLVHVDEELDSWGGGRGEEETAISSSPMRSAATSGYCDNAEEGFLERRGHARKGFLPREALRSSCFARNPRKPLQTAPSAAVGALKKLGFAVERAAREGEISWTEAAEFVQVYGKAKILHQPMLAALEEILLLGLPMADAKSLSILANGLTRLHLWNHPLLPLIFQRAHSVLRGASWQSLALLLQAASKGGCCCADEKLVQMICCEVLSRLKAEGAWGEAHVSSAGPSVTDTQCTQRLAVPAAALQSAPRARSISIIAYSLCKAFPVLESFSEGRRWELLSRLTQRAAEAVRAFKSAELANTTFAIAAFARKARGTASGSSATASSVCRPNLLRGASAYFKLLGERLEEMLQNGQQLESAADVRLST
ncbi:hypothetical protein cyc_05612 [Cyclospora cayetanensis]|uniref:Uncharacterized protein n=1 Tax=Cyclospora cayetanensis TaxID=88456 RepID=A0A1D3D923_9EIME|nr:hypothetical protein cyc_05612 [Cyclospora cayetanensis]